ncbi:Xaa-Pro dipeptidase [Methylomarinovum caldicuralii]|uniref:Xaa-Pro dipeptidase n=1 Tax=Methylomarinovum caldicuralii TaxID=438856 RepID=A0AAU9CRR8_9GAMM|nr:YigZ family protein [Methylomarinovum caldicuralii]BCX82227.1 Xaa-Pro dipeptidase [Methylomarinovum caldicuralii]
MSRVFTVREPAEAEYEIKRSRFIAVIGPTADSTELEAFLTGLARRHPQATHLTYAWRIETPQGLRERAFDAGEPSGTAGRPILAHLQGRHLVNVCLAVIRYFGGIKLGAGGLARAYGHAAKLVVEQARIVPHVIYQPVTAEIDYSRFQHLDRQLAPLGARILDADYGARVKVTLEVPEDNLGELERLLASH